MLKELLDKIFSDDDIKTKFLECPSSVKKHHPYKFGNLEHTIGMIKIFENLEAFYNRNTNLDIRSYLYWKYSARYRQNI